MFCVLDGTTYHFGSLNGGLIIYTFPYPQPDTTADRLAFGFTTSTQRRATLVRLTSSNSEDKLVVSIAVWVE